MKGEIKLEDVEIEEYLDNIESALIQLKKKAIYEKKVDLAKNESLG